MTPENKEDLQKINLNDLILLDTLEFCALFHISLRTAYEWRRDGVIPYIRIQGRIYYRLSDVFASMEYFKLNNHREIKNTQKSEE